MGRKRLQTTEFVCPSGSVYALAMPRGIYGSPARVQAQLAARNTVVGSAFPQASEEGGGSKWGPLVAVAAVTGVIAFGAATTSFTGKKKRRHPTSPFRSLG